MTEHSGECEECGQIHAALDPLKAVSWPLADYILSATTEGSRTRTDAMNRLLKCIEEIRATLARGQFH
jgi:hypothetical protein